MGENVSAETLEIATRLIHELELLQGGYGCDEVRVTFRRPDGRLGGRILWDGKEGAFFVDFGLYGS